MRRPLLSALICGLMALSPARAQEGPLAVLSEAEGKLASQDAAELRDAAWATCILVGHQQDAVVDRFSKAGWTRVDYEEGTFSFTAPGAMSELLWVMLYEGESSCSVVDLQTGTAKAATILDAMLDEQVFRIEQVTPEDDCPFERITLPAGKYNPEMIFTVQVISGGDYGDCTSEEASAVLVDTVE